MPFEPDPRALARFNSRLTSQLKAANIELYEGAISDKNGHIEFHQSHGTNPAVGWYEGGWDLSGSIKTPKEHKNAIPSITFEKTVSVTTTTLDAWMQQKSIPVVDLAWIDVQGAEKQVLDGARETLTKTRFIHLEYCDVEMYEGQMNLQQKLEQLPHFEVIQVYGGDILIKNKTLP
jgi:FkbM family methyltransferase